MRRLTSLSTLVVAAALAAGCGETVQAPEETGQPVENPVSFAKGGNAACPIPPTTVVTDEASLVAAVANANPGDVIGIDGLIELTTSQPGGFGIVVGTDDVTITCATAGSGLFGDVGGDTSMVRVTGNRVAVDRLHLDGRQVLATYIGNGEDLSFTRNSVRCGGVCNLFQGALAPYVAHNFFDATDPGVGTFYAIIIQVGATDALVERNDVVGSGVTGIRIRSGGNHTLVHNSVSGAWGSSMLLVTIGLELTGTEIRSNHLEGATDFGLVIGTEGGFVATGNNIRNNRITGAGQAGVSVDQACNNTFQGNELNGNPDAGLIFHDETGANTYSGDKNVVVDNGNFDCDGDGVPDPNDVRGP